MRSSSLLLVIMIMALAGCVSEPDGPVWKIAEAEAAMVSPAEAERIFRALDAARRVGTDPHISGFPVRAATVVEQDGREHVVIGGDTEYQVPEAIHGETSLLNHIANQLGAQATHEMKFIAFYTDGTCGSSLSCGDCRDYQIAKTDWENLLVACGQGSDGTVRIRKFSAAVVHEETFPEVSLDQIPLPAADLERLLAAAREVQRRGITLFTKDEQQVGAAGLSSRGAIYRAAGADDAAFHYRFPIGGLLQQAASEGDYFIRAIAVAGAPGRWPRVSYRERQFGYESSSFNKRRGLDPILLILTDGEGRYRLTTFEEALPLAFSTDRFMPQAVEEFFRSRVEPATEAATADSPPPGRR